MKKIASIIIGLALVISAIGQAPKDSSARPADQTAPAQPTPRAGRIKGRVTAEGRPVAEASILAFPVNITSNLEGAVTSLFRPVSSDADGRFELTGLRAGAYTISASSPGYVVSEQESKTYYRPGDTATLTLVKGGVITGKVTNASGDPLVGAVVRAIKVREPDDKPARLRGGVMSQIMDAMSQILGPYKTDDRGIYRIYGLAPGVYQVAAGGKGAEGFSLGGSNAYDGDAPTYYPSSSLDTAADVTVVAGGEATNIDIRYRNNRGYSISGTISVASGPAPQGTSVLLTRASTGVVEATATALSARAENKYVFDSVLDGEYIVTAMGGSGMPMGAEGISASLSESRRVVVKGLDVSGVDLILEPLASVAGRALVEPLQDTKQKPECKDFRPTPLEGVVLGTRDQKKQATVDPLSMSLAEFKNTTPNEKGEFVISLLRAGVHRVEAGLPNEFLYVKSVIHQPDPAAKATDVAKGGITLKSGDKLKGLVVTLAEGAAGLRGAIVTGADNKPPQSKMRVHLVPSEREAADEILRYYEVEAGADGTFALTNLAPGSYWLVAREINQADQDESDHKPLAWDAGARVSLRFEGEASKKVIELSRCQRVIDYVLNYTPLIKPSKAAAKKPAP